MLSEIDAFIGSLVLRGAQAQTCKSVGRYVRRMIDPALLERTIESESVEISELKKTVVRSRAAELEADPSIALAWDELDARLASRLGQSV